MESEGRKRRSQIRNHQRGEKKKRGGNFDLPPLKETKKEKRREGHVSLSRKKGKKKERGGLPKFLSIKLKRDNFGGGGRGKKLFS